VPDCPAKSILPQPHDWLPGASANTEVENNKVDTINSFFIINPYKTLLNNTYFKRNLILIYILKKF
jgi:hypothetical protein